MALIACEELSVGNEGREIVHGVSFTVEQGAYLGILGENGSGKSTLLRTILGLQRPLRGRIRIDPDLAGGGIGYLPQRTAVQRDFPASVWEVVLSGCVGRLGLRPFYGREEKRAASETMERLGIAALAGRCFRELSGGQQQRALLARALCAGRSLLLLDEPVTGLDPEATEGLYDLIGRLNARDSVAVVMISHDLPAVLRYASHILCIRDGAASFSTKDAYLRTGPGVPDTRGGGQT